MRGPQLVKRADAGAQEMKKWNILNESEPAASSTLSAERSTAMSNLTKKMVLLCSIYDMGFRNLAKVHELGVG